MRKVCISFVLALTLISAFLHLKVNAIQCTGDRYSVDRIISATELESLGCFSLSEYDSAVVVFDQKTKVDGLKNVIITYFGDNPTTTIVETDFSKIVAADRAMAYSQNLVYTNSATMNIYANSTLTSGYTYINDRNQLFYYGTVRYNGTGNITPSNLSALVSVNGAKGYAKVNQIQIIPLIYLDNGWTYNIDISTGVKTIVPKQAYYSVSNDVKTTINGSQTFKQLKVVLNYISTSNSTNEISLAPDWLPVGSYYSPDGILFYYDVDLTQPVYNGTTIGKFYNYYSYTNLRSRSNYTGSELNTYLSYYQSANNQNPSSSTMTNAGEYFISAQNTYGMNALMIYSMGALESGFGRSTYAQNPANLNGLIVKDSSTLALLPYTVATFCATFPSGKYADELNVIHYCLGRYNLFGWGAVDSNPDNAAAFSSIEACVNEHMGINLRRTYMSYNSSVFYASNIGNKGAGLNTKYASDPWWSAGISGIAYRIDRYLGFKDLNTIQLGILDSSVTRNIYKDAQLSTVFYNVYSRATNYPVIILEGIMVNGKLVYKVQTTNPINLDGTINNDQNTILIAYDAQRSIGYIDADLITDYISKFVTGVVHHGLYNTDKQIFFTSGTATINGSSILSGDTVSSEGTYDLVATSSSGVVQNLQFTIDKTAPIITIDNYSTQPTNQNITVTATVNEGQLETNTATFTENGSFVFKATDNAGNISEKTVTIDNIDLIPPIITIEDFDNTTISASDIIVNAQTNEGTLNTDSYTFMRNGSYTFIATDPAGNISSKLVSVSNIVKPILLSYDSELIGGLLEANISSIPVVSGSTVYSTDQVSFKVTLNSKYHIYKWNFNLESLNTRLTTLTLDYPYLDTSVSIEFYMEADLNDDGKVTTTDLVQLRRYIAGLETPNEKAVLSADVNGDGKVSTTDLVKIRRMLAGLE
ncbi:MAG: hypothetical protein HGB31_00035 [Erysipelotrichaceae bacterium]|nr:hypothetical protein [Erysipelotrichaceae bacterium]